MIDRDKELEIVRNAQPDKVAVFEKAYNSHSLKAGIKAKCLQCRELDCLAIRNCEFVGCTLHNIRPYQPENTKVLKTKAGNDENYHKQS